MNRYQQKIREMAIDYANRNSNASNRDAYFDGAMAAFVVIFGEEAKDLIKGIIQFT